MPVHDPKHAVPPKGIELTAQAVARTRGRKCLYNNISFALRPGKMVALVGPNGSGKTSLLRDLAGLTTPDTGVVELANKGLASLPLRVRARQIAYLPQHTPADPDLLVRDIVALGRAPYWRTVGQTHPEDLAAIDAAVNAVSVAPLLHRRVGSLSGGEHQRVMLARMLATRAAFCLLDEPTAALDIGHAIDFLHLCREQCSRGTGLLLALHDLDLALQIADEVILLHGDGTGTTTVGPTRSVLTPHRVRTVFSVHADLCDGHLVFSSFALAEHRQVSPVNPATIAAQAAETARG